jgi:hypothetical protein
MTEPLALSQLDQPSAAESIEGLITQYLLERVSEFRDLTDLRRKVSRFGSLQYRAFS